MSRFREITAAEFGNEMVKLDQRPEFTTLRGAWLTRRSEIINTAKKTRKPEDIAVLEGFDMAIKCFEDGLRYAGTVDRTDPAKEISKKFAEAGHD